MIAGEGLAGVLIAFLVAGSGRWTGLRDTLASMHFASRDFTHFDGAAAVVIGIAIVLAVCVLLYRAGRSISSLPDDAVNALVVKAKSPKYDERLAAYDALIALGEPGKQALEPVLRDAEEKAAREFLDIARSGAAAGFRTWLKM